MPPEFREILRLGFQQIVGKPDHSIGRMLITTDVCAREGVENARIEIKMNQHFPSFTFLSRSIIF
jgi:hypothetical protein